MRVSFVQMRPEFGNKKANIEKAISLMETKAADLYVLPELFNSGYVFTSKEEVSGLAEKAGEGETYDAIQDFAVGHKCAVIYGFPEKASEGNYNSALFVDYKRNIKVYRKIQLFFEEKIYFQPGNFHLETVDYAGAKLGIMVCYDWIYPEITRVLALKGAHIICHPVNLVMPYCQEAMKTRSIENRVFTITSNRYGEERRGGKGFKFTGQSQITDCKGNVLYRASENKDEIFVADIEIKEAEDKNMNALNNLWDDRRTEYYKRLGE